MLYYKYLLCEIVSERLNRALSYQLALNTDTLLTGED